MLPFAILGMALGLYVLWALAAFPTHVFLERNSIAYINTATHNSAVAVTYVIVTCGALFFSKVKEMVLFGIANLSILLITMAIREYAFTSVWCAYAAAASLIIWLGLHRNRERRPFCYREAM